METLSGILIFAAIIFCCFLLLKVFTAPLRGLMKLLLNTAIGFITLFIINFFGGFIGFTIPINLVNSAIVGVFGLPGAIFLAIMKLLF